MSAGWLLAVNRLGAGGIGRSPSDPAQRLWRASRLRFLVFPIFNSAMQIASAMQSALCILHSGCGDTLAAGPFFPRGAKHVLEPCDTGYQDEGEGEGKGKGKGKG